MKKDDRYIRLRELIIEEIQQTGSSIIPSRTVLNKKSDSSLVKSLFDNSVAAEMEIWKEDLFKAAKKINANGRISQNSSSKNLITNLIKIAQDAAREEMENEEAG